MKTSKEVPLLLFSCREASRLASESLDRELTRRERWALRIHKCICHTCRRFAAQIGTMRDSVAKMPDNLRKQIFNKTSKLSTERRVQIKRLLAEASNTDSQN